MNSPLESHAGRIEFLYRVVRKREAKIDPIRRFNFLIVDFRHTSTRF